MIIFAVISLFTAGSILAQNSAGEANRETLTAQREAEIAQKQAEVAQKQVEVARRQALIAEKEAALARTAPAPRPALPTPPVPPASTGVSIPSVSFNRLWPSQSGGAGSVLVIPSAEIKAEDIVAITEDMNVMSRIFEKNLEQARITTAHGSLFASRRDSFIALLGADSGAIESMYLQGYGALFFVKVDFPLSGPPEAEEVEQQIAKQEESDPVWEEMKRQMYEPQGSARRKAKEPQEKYDAEKVENLKTTLVGALKHAANIRSLKPDELVILTVTGSGESGENRLTVPTGRAISMSRGSQIIVQEKGNDGKTTTRVVQSPSTGIAGSLTPTVLVIRAKKSDIDKFAEGNLDINQFQQRTQILSCPYLGGETGRGDSFNAYY
jgi:hypothetical protein